MIVQFIRDVMYSEVFSPQDGDIDFVLVEAGNVGELLEDGSVSMNNDYGFYYPSDSYTNANPL
jgi:hypothetical protein